jgi:hypothetical protein
MNICLVVFQTLANRKTDLFLVNYTDTYASASRDKDEHEALPEIQA